MSKLRSGTKRHGEKDNCHEHDFATFAANLVSRLISESSTSSRKNPRAVKRKQLQGAKSAACKNNLHGKADEKKKSRKLEIAGPSDSCSVLLRSEDADVNFVEFEPESEDIKYVKAEPDDTDFIKLEAKTVEDDASVDEDVKPYPVKIENPSPIPLVTLDDEISKSDGETIACKNTSQSASESGVEEPSKPKKRRSPRGPKQEPKSKTVKCPYCNKNFTGKQPKTSLNTHIKQLHTGEALKFSCEICDQQYPKKWQLENHWRKSQHKECDLLKCPHCPKTFTSSTGHKYHIERHQEQPKFECPTCKTKFHRLFVLNGHLKSHVVPQKTQSNNAKFACSLCKKAFISNRDLQEHLNRHNGVRPHLCQYCSKSFASRRDVLRHARVHLGNTGAKEYKCEECDQYFTHSGALKYHVRTHTKSQPFECVQCGSKFRSKASGKRHWQRRHEKKGFSFENCIIGSGS